jgi:hypothetical protein
MIKFRYYYEYESDSDGECPPTPEPASPSFDPDDYSSGDGGFTPYLRNCPGYANIALEHYNSQDNHEVKFLTISVSNLCIYALEFYFLSNVNM